MAGTEATSGSGGAEPGPKRRRLLDAGGPVEDDETARQKMRDAEVYDKTADNSIGVYAGFDPDNVSDFRSKQGFRVAEDSITPMGYFAEKGDLPMMRWLYVNGACTRDEDAGFFYYPMYTAASRGHLGVCKWLFQHGAAEDVHSVTLSGSFRRYTRDVSRWLILRGALCAADDTGDLHIGQMRQILDWSEESARERPELLKWAKEHHQTRSSFEVFLMGTLSPPTYSAAKLRDELMAKIGIPSAVDRILAIAPPDQCRLLWDDLFAHRVCNLTVFSGKSGILELIGAYVGTVRGREARIVRQLTELLPDVIIELDRETDSDESSSDDSDY